jgi:hypothetical protein
MFPLALSGSSRNQETALGRSSVEPISDISLEQVKTYINNQKNSR